MPKVLSNLLNVQKIFLLNILCQHTFLCELPYTDSVVIKLNPF